MSVGRMFGGVFGLVVVFTEAIGCGDDGGGADVERVRGGDRIGGTVVATVDGFGITVGDVADLARHAAASPEQALADLEDQELLAAEARRLGYDRRRSVREAGVRARVRRLLAERVEAVVSAETISDTVIAARYARDAARYQQGERRRSRHLLIRVPEGADEALWDAAEAQAAGVLAEALAHAPDVDPVFAAVTVDPPLTVLVEALEPVARDGSLQQDYEAALFETEAGHVHPRLVRSTYGVHVVFVDQVVPAVELSLEEATPEIREVLVVEGRAALTSERLESLGRTYPVEVNDAAFARAMAVEFDP